MTILCRHVGHDDDHDSYSIDIMSRFEAQYQKKTDILSTYRECKNLEELHWISRDIAAMLGHDQFQKQFRFLKEGIRSRDLTKAPNTRKRYSRTDREAENTLRQTDTAASNIASTESYLSQSGCEKGLRPVSSAEYLAAGGKYGTVVTEHLGNLKEKLAGYKINETQVRDTEQALDTLLRLMKGVFENME